VKAIVFRRHGGPEVLEYGDAPEPQIKANEVLVRVRAVALNHLDLWVRRGLPGIEIPLPHIPGSDVAGEIAKVGELVTWVKAGDKVLLAPGVSCGQCAVCAGGADNQCRRYTNLGYMIDGGCAEYVKAPEVNAIAIPGELSWEEAAAVPLVFLTAWHMLVGRAQVRAGEDVLVLGAGSGVGSAAIQIAKLLGARVIATTSSAGKIQKARDLGADEVIDYTREDVQTEVRRLTARRGVDVVFEHVGTATWESSVLCLTTGGRLVTCGATTGYAAKVDIRYLFSRHLSLLGSYMGSKGELHAVVKLIGERKLRAVVDRVMPLSECRRAHEILESREQFGKIVLTP
jgi:NADPH:quinone reductase-like Zn-dependent oxidoreductase